MNFKSCIICPSTEDNHLNLESAIYSFLASQSQGHALTSSNSLLPNLPNIGESRDQHPQASLANIGESRDRQRKCMDYQIRITK